MEYNKVIAVTGLPGLYELLSSKSDGAIVRSLDDKSTRFVSSRIHNFSHLESIEIYTVRENVNLVDVLKAMEGSGEKLPDDKDNTALKAYFTKVYPDMDFSRVYTSDLKKMVKWFSVLKANNVEIKLSEPAEEEEAAEPEEAVGEKAPAKPKKEKAAAAEEKPAVKEKKAAVKKEEEEEEEEPKAKKAAPKKKAAEKAPAETSKKKAAEAPKKAAAKKK
ncbi:DUF5606 domain-containing protein [Flavitalea sp. BT771]|uniref:DUF5606 family protein n=1 Tax=Flavitalea sp. BT771 TaxID=3063329 RepID=UPI0026E3DE98|nr:DUF5606 domain-containing protein [Flavitalea sp. BT771]MDO6433388.1 DUF5606 domain-containing protein [Flavitalea sp. BT771]MDV6222707.1 DUF5606 domain-containing protein [Flavitalea sp. BT771]